MPSRFSPSQLNAWQSCRFKWHMRYELGLMKPAERWMTASGSAVHGVVEARLKNEIKPMHSQAKAESILAEHFVGFDDQQEQVKRYLPGALRAISRLPDWIWQHDDWHVEEEIEYTWEGSPETIGSGKHFAATKPVTIFGKPDFWRFSDDGSHIQLLELKSTSSTKKRPREYLTFNPQHRYYALILSKLYNLPVFVNYIVVRTGAKNTAAMESTEFLINDRALLQAEDELLRVASEVGTLEIVPFYSGACPFCDFADVCEAAVGGADWQAIANETLVPREPS